MTEKPAAIDPTHPVERDQRQMEVFSPPYLGLGPRPVIAAPRRRVRMAPRSPWTRRTPGQSYPWSSYGPTRSRTTPTPDIDGFAFDRRHPGEQHGRPAAVGPDDRTAGLLHALHPQRHGCALVASFIRIT